MQEKVLRLCALLPKKAFRIFPPEIFSVKTSRKGLPSDPRTIAQDEALDRLTDIDYVINLDVDLEKLVDRITGRRVCEKCGESYHVSTKKDDNCEKCDGKLIQRADDTEETVKSRLNVYKNETAPLIEFYKKQGVLVNVDGMQTIDEVYQAILEALKD